MKQAIMMGILAAGLAACQDRAPAPAERTDANGMQGMQGMQNMPAGGMMMMSQMRAHMDSMQSMSAQHRQQMLPAHRQMVANMLAEFNRQMRDMNMTADASWNALTDSIRSDLTTLPEMSGTELRNFMPRHGARVMRLMEMHETMMRGMGM